MLTVYLNSPQGPSTVTGASSVPDEAAWVDLNRPSASEETIVEAALKVDIPTREELYEIEASSRLFKEGDAIFMTATVITNADTAMPESAAVTFILVGQRLVTLRYGPSVAFTNFVQRLQREPAMLASGELVLAGLLEAIIDRIWKRYRGKSSAGPRRPRLSSRRRNCATYSDA
jgi:magnesium transporter